MRLQAVYFFAYVLYRTVYTILDIYQSIVGLLDEEINHRDTEFTEKN